MSDQTSVELTPVESIAERTRAAITASVTETIRAKFAAAIAEDQRCRVPGVTEGLYRLADLGEFHRVEPSWGIPTLMQKDPPKFDRARGDGDFKDRFAAVLPELAAFDFEKHGVYPAGGAVTAAVMFRDRREYQRRNDVDLFLVGHESPDAARRAIYSLYSHLAVQWAGYGLSSMRIFRTRNCITFYHPDASCTAIQVILRLYSTSGEVIHGFDLGASAFLWTGRAVVMTGMAVLAATHGVNVLNLAARRGSYESRLERYFNRGFDIVLPNLAVGKINYVINGINRIDFPFMSAFLAHAIDGGCVKVYWLRAAFSPSEVSDYAPYEMAYNNPAGLNLRNIAAVASEAVNEKMLCAMATVSNNDIFDKQPEICTREFTSHILGMMNSANINVIRLKRYLGADATSLLMIDYLAKGVVDEALVKRLCKARAQELKGRIANALPFRFMDVQADTALVAPFDRATIAPAAWYGRLYSPKSAF